MALSEDAIAIVAAQLTTARLASKNSDEVSRSLVFEVFSDFRELVQKAEDARDREKIGNTRSTVAFSRD